MDDGIAIIVEDTYDWYNYFTHVEWSNPAFLALKRSPGI